MHIFIAYDKQDKSYIEYLSSALQSHQIQTWHDENMMIGVAKDEEIQRRIETASAVIVLLSEDSIRSRTIKNQIIVAERNKKLIAPVLLGELRERDFPIWMGSRNCADARNGKNPVPDLVKTIHQIREGKTTLQNSQSSVKLIRKKGFLNTLTTTLVVVKDGGKISKNRIGINPNDGLNAVHGLFTSFPTDSDEIRKTEIAVHVLSIDTIPKGHIIVSEALIEQLGITNPEYDEWELQLTDLNVIIPQEIELELTVESPLEEAVWQMEKSKDIDKTLIWFPYGSEEQPIIEIENIPYRITKISPSFKSKNTIIEIQESTEISMFSSGSKSGVDMVILADCSGSMSTDDLTDLSDVFHVETAPVEKKGFFGRLFGNKPKATFKQRSQSRMSAMRKSLNKLLEMRMQLEGRVSRIALVSFTENCSIKFPKQGKGMMELDGNSDDITKQAFKDAVGLLVASGGTNIGKALSYAAELLYKHGKPGNDRLIVLISDGATWQPKSMEATGEVVSGLDEPITLMEHLHENMGIHLHAIGISRLELFDRWFRKKYSGTPHISMIPNHELLEQLVEVGGGDPTRTGDTDVLEDYFSGLGAGMTRKVRKIGKAKIPSLQSWEIQTISELKNKVVISKENEETRRKREKLFKDILNGITEVNDSSERVLGKQIITLHTQSQQLLAQVKLPTNDSVAFRKFSINLRKIALQLNTEISLDGLTKELSQIVNHFNTAGIVKQLRQIPRVFQHPNDIQNSPKKLEMVIKEFIGVTEIEAHDAEKWRNLQLSILAEVKKFLSEMSDEFNDYLFENVEEENENKGQVVEQPEFVFID